MGWKSHWIKIVWAAVPLHESIVNKQKVASSIPDEVIGFFSIDLILPVALGPGVYSASNKNEYQELIK
jgi:hypothetical protein